MESAGAPRSDLPPPGPHAASVFRAGEAVQVNFEGRWYDSVIHHVYSQDSFRVVYLEDNTYEDVRRSYIRERHGAPSRDWSSRKWALSFCFCGTTSLLVVIFAAVAGIATRPPEIEMGLESFTEADVPSFLLRSAFLSAVDQLRGGSESRRLQESRLFRRFEIQLVYEVTDGREIPEVSASQAIRTFERKLRDLPTWKLLCKERAIKEFEHLCDPGVSFTIYLSPGAHTQGENSIVPVALRLGETGEVLPPHTAVHLAKRSGLDGFMFPIAFSDAPLNDAPRLTLLRSVFLFKMFCCMSDTPVAEQKGWVEEVRNEWKTFMSDEVLPMLKSPSLNGISVFWLGSHIDQVEAMQTISGDLRLAAGSFCFVVFYLVLHTRSIVLSIVGFATVFLSVPLTYVIFMVLSGSSTLNIASFLSLFLVVGLGSDVVFVYTDAWNSSATKYHLVGPRVMWTYRMALKSTFATSFTTAISFFANLASVLRPLREFGFFMGLCVMLVWLLVPLIFMPYCVVGDVLCGNLRPAASHFDCCAVKCRRGGVVKKFALHLLRWKRLYFFGALFLEIIATPFAVFSMRTSTATPRLLPPDHNQYTRDRVLAAFNGVARLKEPIVPTEIDVCAEGTNSSVSMGDGMGCPLFWCEASRRPENETGCRCYRKQERGCNSPVVPVSQRIVGMSSTLLASALGDQLLEYQASPGQWTGSRESTRALQDLSPMVLHDWLSGRMVLEPVAQLEAELQQDLSNAVNLSCGLQDICFCRDLVCSLDESWKELPLLEPGQRRIGLESDIVDVSQPRQLPWPARPGVGPRRLVLVDDRANVEVVFGLEVRTSLKLLGDSEVRSSWAFDPRFRAQDPWTQRLQYDMCAELDPATRSTSSTLAKRSPLAAQLRVTAATCWITHFRKFAEQSTGRFPVRSEAFDEVIDSFKSRSIPTVGQSASQRVENLMWFSGVEMKATFMVFSIDVDKRASARVATYYNGLWDEYIAWRNGLDVHGCTFGFHTSTLWVYAEVQRELLASVVTTLVIIVVLAFVAVHLFTGSLICSIFVVASTTQVLCFLLVAIVLVMGLSIGPVEAIALIAFLGYSVTYSLHIAHLYSNWKDSLEVPKDVNAAVVIRFARVQYALTYIGSAIFGSAVTTLGCSLFLICSKITIFRRLGIVAVIVTFLSVLSGLFFQAALLLECGPVHPGHLWLRSLVARVLARIPGMRPRPVAEELPVVPPATREARPLGPIGAPPCTKYSI